MKNEMKKLILIPGAILAAMICVALVWTMNANGKENEYKTNQSDPDFVVNRGEQMPVTDEAITYDGVTFEFGLPEGFYFESESDQLGHGILREYMDHNFTIMADIYLYKNYTGDVGLIDMEHPENTVALQNVLVDATEWFREMRITYLEREDDADIQTAQFGDVTVTYMTKYFKNANGNMQGTLLGYTPIDEEHFFAFKIVEFDEEQAPSMEEYSALFTK